jgi:hypothetical protein
MAASFVAAAHMALPVTHLVSVEVVEGSVSMLRQRTAVAVMLTVWTNWRYTDVDCDPCRCKPRTTQRSSG